MLDAMQAFLQTFPEWEGTLQLDDSEDVPGSSGLYPKGLTELSRREDVLGNLRIRYRYGFTLRRVCAPGEENARWLLALQHWVAEQDRLGLAPKFGDEPKTERIRALEGGLSNHTQTGGAVYTVQISAEFTKFYEVR